MISFILFIIFMMYVLLVIGSVCIGFKQLLKLTPKKIIHWYKHCYDNQQN